MKHSKKIPVMLMVLCLCTLFAVCGTSAGNTGDDSMQAEDVAESVAKDSTDGELSEVQGKAPDQTSEQTDDIIIGLICSHTGWTAEEVFAQTVETTLSDQYSDHIGEVIIKSSDLDYGLFHGHLENFIAAWGNEKIVLLIVNSENGFSDEELLSFLQDADKAGIITGVDHVIDGAPESTFVYDASDAAGCAAMIMENALIGSIESTDPMFDGFTDFYYTYDASSFPPYYQRYRFYVEDGEYFFYHETREGDEWPQTEEDITASGTVKLTENDRRDFFALLEGGTIKEPEITDGDGSAGPWTYIYRGNGQEEYAFPSYSARLAFEEFCEGLSSMETKAADEKQAIIN